jgi:hypothetical protein
MGIQQRLDIRKRLTKVFVLVEIVFERMWNIENEFNTHHDHTSGEFNHHGSIYDRGHACSLLFCHQVFRKRMFRYSHFVAVMVVKDN